MGTWDVKITVLDVDTKTVSVAAIRTYGADVQTFNILSAVIATSQQKQDVLDNIWGQYQQSKLRNDKIAAFIGDLEQQAKTALEAKEI